MSGAQEPLEHLAAGQRAVGQLRYPPAARSKSIRISPQIRAATAAISLSLLGKCQYSAIGRSLFATQPSMGAKLVVTGSFVVPEMDPTASRRRRTRSGRATPLLGCFRSGGCRLAAGGLRLVLWLRRRLG
jgi:hypothetical protein